MVLVGGVGWDRYLAGAGALPGVAGHCDPGSWPRPGVTRGQTRPLVRLQQPATREWEMSKTIHLILSKTIYLVLSFVFWYICLWQRLFILTERENFTLIKVKTPPPKQSKPHYTTSNLVPIVYFKYHHYQHQKWRKSPKSSPSSLPIHGQLFLLQKVKQLGTIIPMRLSIIDTLIIVTAIRVGKHIVLPCTSPRIKPTTEHRNVSMVLLISKTLHLFKSHFLYYFFPKQNGTIIICYSCRHSVTSELYETFLR